MIAFLHSLQSLHRSVHREAMRNKSSPQSISLEGINTSDKNAEPELLADLNTLKSQLMQTSNPLIVRLLSQNPNCAW